jgi:hypothetical protein
MDVRRAAMRLIHCADADEADRRSGLRVVAPNGHPANGTTRDPLSLATGGRRVDQLGLAAEVLDPIGFIHRVQRVCRSCLALTPGAVTGMNNQRRARQTVSNVPTCTSTFHVILASLTFGTKVRNITRTYTTCCMDQDFKKVSSSPLQYGGASGLRWWAESPPYLLREIPPA